MVKLKKRLSSVLAVVLTVITCLSSVPVKATEATPKVTFVGVEHSPLVVGDTETFYLSSVGAEKVQYRVFQNKIGTDKWQELTPGYTAAVNANEISSINGIAKYEIGKYKLSIWVKKADTEGKFKNKSGDYDSYYVTYLNCVSKDNSNRVYSNGDMNVEKDNYVVGETVNIAGIKDISGMKAPYTYKLHIYDVNNNMWIMDKTNYRDKENLTWVANKPGTYVLDLWTMSSNSTLWAKQAKLNGRVYEAWKLKVITVKDKVEPTEINLVEKGEIYGSKDVNQPMEINKNVNITANDVVLNNVNVKGNVTITGDNVTLNNVKVQGTLVLNPGENGTVSLNNVNADKIEVLSGASNSIHFNNVNALKLVVNSNNVKNVVRIEIKGKTKIESTTVASNVILEATEGSFGEIGTTENTDKKEFTIELRGTFDKDIKANNKVTIKLANNAKVISITVNTNVNLDLGSGAVVTTLNNSNNVTVTQTGTGIVITIVKPIAPTPGTGGGTTPPTLPTTPIPASIDKLVTDSMKLMQDNTYITVSNYDTSNILARSIDVSIKQPDLTFTKLFQEKADADLLALLPFADLITGINSLNINISTTTGTITNTETLKAFLNVKRIGTEFANMSTVELLYMFKKMTYTEFAEYAKIYSSENEDFSINVEGLEISKISAKGTKIYDKAVGDMRITQVDTKTVFPKINTDAMTLGDLKGTYIVTAIINNQTITFTVNVK